MHSVPPEVDKGATGNEQRDGNCRAEAEVLKRKTLRFLKRNNYFGLRI
jgi:hypothetical protein